MYFTFNPKFCMYFLKGDLQRYNNEHINSEVLPFFLRSFKLLSGFHLEVTPFNYKRSFSWVNFTRSLSLLNFCRFLFQTASAAFPSHGTSLSSLSLRVFVACALRRPIYGLIVFLTVTLFFSTIYISSASACVTSLSITVGSPFVV